MVRRRHSCMPSVALHEWLTAVSRPANHHLTTVCLLRVGVGVAVEERHLPGCGLFHTSRCAFNHHRRALRAPAFPAPLHPLSFTPQQADRCQLDAQLLDTGEGTLSTRMSCSGYSNCLPMALACLSATRCRCASQVLSRSMGRAECEWMICSSGGSSSRPSSRRRSTSKRFKWLGQSR